MKMSKFIWILVFIALSANASCENKLFSFSIKDADNQSIRIIDVLENITDECQMSLVLEDASAKSALNKKLNYIKVRDFSLENLLDLILGDNNIFYSISDDQNILRVAQFKTKTYFIDYVSFSERSSSSSKVIKTGSSGSGEGEDSTTMDYTSNFLFWEKMASEIDYILFRDEDAHQMKSKALINQEAGMLTVTGTKKQLDRVEKYITSVMGRLHKEVLLEAKIIEVEYTDENTQGIDWSKFELSVSGSSDAIRSRTLDAEGGTSDLVEGFRAPNYLVGYNFSMDGLIKFLKTQGDVSIVSNPKVMTLNNQPAVINVGKEINYRYDTGSTTNISNGTTTTSPSYEVDSTFVGVTLDITPQVTDNDYIILKINPVVSEVTKNNVNEDGIPFLAPDIQVKQLSSIVKVKNNNKVLVGGLISKSENTEDTSVPLLSSLPILGNAFKSSSINKTNTEMIMVLIPRIVDGHQSPSLDDFEDNTFISKELE